MYHLFFTGNNPDGVRYVQYFKNSPLPLLALIATVVSQFHYVEYYELSDVDLRWSALSLVGKLEYLSKKTSGMRIINQSMSFYIFDRHISRLTYDTGINFIYAFSRIFRRRLQGGQRK